MLIMFLFFYLPSLNLGRVGCEISEASCIIFIWEFSKLLFSFQIYLFCSFSLILSVVMIQKWLEFNWFKNGWIFEEKRLCDHDWRINQENGKQIIQIDINGTDVAELPNGNIMVSCFDSGAINIYDQNFNMIKKITTMVLL